jgi:hypothetical protein
VGLKAVCMVHEGGSITPASFLNFNLNGRYTRREMHLSAQLCMYVVLDGFGMKLTG